MAALLKQLERDELPSSLQEIPDPPKRLYVRGALPPETMPWLAVVGSRAMTSYGKQVCEHLITGLAGQPIVIVSGLAYGIDACAHTAALAAGLTCVAVPGSGLDDSVLYPRAHVLLAREIERSGGALVSEFEPKMKAAPYTFPRRNRIMVGLSKAVLLIEAREKSGTLITARLTAEYNRDLLVVPGSIFSEQSRGAHQFLKLGALPITQSDDIVRALGLETHSRPADTSDMTVHERILYDLLECERDRDALVTLSGLSASETAIALATLELKGVIQEELGVVHRAL